MSGETVAESRGFWAALRAILGHAWAHHYIQVFLCLLVLTALTVGASYLPIPTAGHVFVALAIALVKAGLVAAAFMHLLWEKIVIHRLMAFTVFFMLGLIVLSVLALKDLPVGTL